MVTKTVPDKPDLIGKSLDRVTDNLTRFKKEVWTLCVAAKAVSHRLENEQSRPRQGSGEFPMHPRLDDEDAELERLQDALREVELWY